MCVGNYNSQGPIFNTNKWNKQRAACLISQSLVFYNNANSDQRDRLLSLLSEQTE